MNRLEFLKQFGLISGAAAITGMGADTIINNLKDDNGISYVELPQMPGTRFVFGTEDDYILDNKGNKQYEIGYTEVQLEDVKKYWGKNLYLKQPDGSFISYERQIGALISNSDIENLNKGKV